MRIEDHSEFKKLLTGVYDFYAKDLTTFAFDIWWKALVSFDVGAVHQAFDKHLMNPDTGQFIPKPADIVKMLSGRTSDSAQTAWSKVDEAVRKVGTYASVVFDDPLIHRVLQEMGGWIQLGTKTEDEWPFVANEFRTRYQGYRLRGEVPPYPPKMIGVYEAENSKNGYEYTQLMLLGDKTAAKKVYGGGSNRPLLAMTTISDVALLASEKLEHEPLLLVSGGDYG